MNTPPELNLTELEARLKAYAEHTGAMYSRAEAEYQRLHDLHCRKAREELHRWGAESGRALHLLDLLRESRKGRGFRAGFDHDEGPR